MINIKNFVPNLLKINKKSCKNISYITVRDSEYLKTDSVNSLYLIIKEVDGCVEEINGNKYLTEVSTDKSKKSIDKIHRTVEWNKKFYWKIK